jgi:hypothetical protein
MSELPQGVRKQGASRIHFLIPSIKAFQAFMKHKNLSPTSQNTDQSIPNSVPSSHHLKHCTFIVAGGKVFLTSIWSAQMENACI